MGMRTIVTLSPEGDQARDIMIRDLEIPDLWAIARALERCGMVTNGPGSAELILSVWHTAHDLKKHIIKSEI